MRSWSYDARRLLESHGGVAGGVSVLAAEILGLLVDALEGL